MLIAALLGGAALRHFHLRGELMKRESSERSARIQSLQARIRPHFLFNSINGVLSLVRKDPRRAEEALHDMADLFRVLMRDNRELTPLGEEVELCRQYLELEKLRLGDRLGVDWNVRSMPADALVDGFLILLAGILLIIPGVLTDIVGIALLIPPLRALMKRGAKAWLQRLRNSARAPTTQL